jgi:hypothetical protein
MAGQRSFHVVFPITHQHLALIITLAQFRGSHIQLARLLSRCHLFAPLAHILPDQAVLVVQDS